MSKRRFRHNPGGVSSLGAEVLRWPKYRRRILGRRVARRRTVLLEQIADERGGQIMDKDVMPDHGHLFVRLEPTYAGASAVGASKGRSALVLCRKFPQLRDRGKVLWSPSYLAASVGCVAASTIHRCIEHQWAEVAT